MMPPEQVSFDRYLDLIFAGSSRTDACVNMLSVFLENIDSCRENPGQMLPSAAPSIVDQVAAVAERAHRFEMELRRAAEEHGPEFQTAQLGAVLWWAGMASHKAAAAAKTLRAKMARNAWEDAFTEIHALMFDTMSALSLLSVAEGMLRRMEIEGAGRDRPN